MDLVLFVVLLLLFAVGAGFLGSLAGLGGGVIIVPILVLLGVPFVLAVGASAISVLATSTTAGSAYVHDHLTDLRIGMFLEIATTLGAITGAYLASIVEPRLLFVLFGVVLAYSAVAMVRGFKEHAAVATVTQRASDRIADRLDLHDSYYDEAEQRDISYSVSRTKVGLGLMYIAGTVSGLLGVGSGTLKVPAMDLAMGLPIKVSTATSNFMIGVTAAASAGVYFARGDVQPTIAAPVAIGVLVGALGGSRVLPRLRGQRVRQLFVVILVLISADMLWKGVH